MDPLFLGRVRVRILGIHSPDLRDMPTESLPWANVSQPTTSAAQTEVGTSPLGLVEGSWVWGFFRDGKYMQEPLVCGSLGGVALDKNNNPALGFKDLRGLDQSEVFWEFDDNPSVTPFRINRSANPELTTPKKPLEVFLRQRGSKDPATGETLQKNKVFVIENRGFDSYPLDDYLGESTTPSLARPNDPKAKVREGVRTTFGGKEVVPKRGLERFLERNRINFSISEPTFRQGSVPKWGELPSSYAAEYPYNHVTATESGHYLELDDTPKAERVRVAHRTGSYVEMRPDGGVQIKSTGEMRSISFGDSFIGSAGDQYASSMGRINVSAESGIDLVTNQDNLNIQSKGGDVMVKSRNLTFEVDGEITYRSKGKSANMTMSADNMMGNVSRNYQMRIGGNAEIGSESGEVKIVGGTMDIGTNALGQLTISAGGKLVVNATNKTGVYTNLPVGSGDAPGTNQYGIREEVMNGRVLITAVATSLVPGGIDLIAKTAPIPTEQSSLVQPPGAAEVKISPPENPFGVSVNTTGPSGFTATSAVSNFITAGVKNTLTAPITETAGALTALNTSITVAGGLVGTESGVLGTTFAGIYAEHLHITPSGMSGPPTNGTRISQALSRKFFMAG